MVGWYQCFWLHLGLKNSCLTCWSAVVGFSSKSSKDDIKVPIKPHTNKTKQKPLSAQAAAALPPISRPQWSHRGLVCVSAEGLCQVRGHSETWCLLGAVRREAGACSVAAHYLSMFLGHVRSQPQMPNVWTLTDPLQSEGLWKMEGCCTHGGARHRQGIDSCLWLKDAGNTGFTLRENKLPYGMWPFLEEVFLSATGSLWWRKSRLTQ